MDECNPSRTPIRDNIKLLLTQDKEILNIENIY
jgi:hypothetical protein